MTCGNAHRRPGGISILAVLALPVVLLIIGLVVYVSQLRDSRTELQNGADAAALAAARALATDAMLTQDIGRAKKRFAGARDAAANLAGANLAGGERIKLDPNPDNQADGAIVFGSLDKPVGGNFQPVGTDPANWVGNKANAVMVTVRRSAIRGVFGAIGPSGDVLARSVAMLDFGVYGFHPIDDTPTPLVPVAILTDHTGVHPNGWDHLARKAGPDNWAFDAGENKFVPGNDGIPEVTVVFGSPGGKPAARGLFLRVGADSFAVTAMQTKTGLARHDFRQANFPSGFVLGSDNRLAVPGSPQCPPVGSESRNMIDAACREILAGGNPRVWPLVSDYDEDTGKVVVTGFVAARVVAVGSNDDGTLALTLQPAVVCHPALVTEVRADRPDFWANNRTVCRVRLSD